jgi:hypothetical protein
MTERVTYYIGAKRIRIPEAVMRLVYTSVDDVKSTLTLRTDIAELEEASNLAEREGCKTKAHLIRARIRQLQKEQT